MSNHSNGCTHSSASSPSTCSGSGSSLGSSEEDDREAEIGEDDEDDASSLSDVSFHTATATIESLDDDEQPSDSDDEDRSSPGHAEEEGNGNGARVGADDVGEERPETQEQQGPQAPRPQQRPLFLHRLPRPEATRWSSISLSHHDYEEGSGSEDPSLPSSNAASAGHSYSRLELASAAISGPAPELTPPTVPTAKSGTQLPNADVQVEGSTPIPRSLPTPTATAAVEFNVASVSAAGLGDAEDDPRISWVDQSVWMAQLNPHSHSVSESPSTSPLTSPYTSASASALFGSASGRGGGDGSRGSTPPSDPEHDAEHNRVEGGKRTGGYGYDAEWPLAYLTTVNEREGLGGKDGETEKEKEKRKGRGGFGWWKTGKEKKEKEVRSLFKVWTVTIGY